MIASEVHFVTASCIFPQARGQLLLAVLHGTPPLRPLENEKSLSVDDFRVFNPTSCSSLPLLDPDHARVIKIDPILSTDRTRRPTISPLQRAIQTLYPLSSIARNRPRGIPIKTESRHGILSGRANHHFWLSLKTKSIAPMQ